MAKNALVVNTDGTYSTLDVETEFLSKMQNAVDGLIEAIDLSDNLTMWVNEEFLFRGSFEPNLLGTAMYQSVGGGSVILGTIVFTGGTDSEGETLGLDDSDYTRLSAFAEIAKGWVETGVMA
jgi:hypothetical protein